MTPNKWLIISAAAFVFTVLLAATGDCSQTLRDLRGDLAALYGLFMSLAMVITSLLFFYRSYISYTTSRNRWVSFLVICFFIAFFISVFAFAKLSDICNII